MKNYKMTIKLKHFIVYTMFFLYGLSAFAQEHSTIKDVDILEKQKIVLMKDYPHIFTGVEIKDVQKINSKHSKVIYENDNQQYEAVVNSDRKDMLIVATSRVINEKEMPSIVMDAFQSSEYKNWNIEKTFEVTAPNSNLFYRIDVSEKKSGDEKDKIESLFYTHMGAYKKPPY